MKRFSAMVLALAMCVACLSGCGPAAHEHKWGDWVVEKEATCTEVGKKYRECSEDGEKEYADIPMKDHDWDKWVTVKAPTATEAGSAKRQCKVGKEYQEQTLPAFNETDYKIVEKTPGNCIEEAVFTYQHKVTGAQYGEFLGDKDPDNHVLPAYVCGKHCPKCETADNKDHNPANCGHEGHFNCDGLDHTACIIPAAANMNFEKTADGKGAKMLRYTETNSDTAIFVPSFVEIDGETLPVTEIDTAVFEGYESPNSPEVAAWMDTITYVYIPDTVTKVGKELIYNMDALVEVRLPKTLTTANWDRDTFFDNKSLEVFNIPAGITELKGAAVGYSAAAPEGEPYALTTITIPSSFQSLNSIKLFFSMSENLATINYQGTEDMWNALVEKSADLTADGKAKIAAITEAGGLHFGYDYAAQYKEESKTLQSKFSPFLFEANGNEITITGYTGRAMETLEIPDTIMGKPVTKLADGVLDATSVNKNNNEALKAVKAVTFGQNLKEIGRWNFYGMDNLLKVEIPANVFMVGEQCFVECPQLTEVTIADGVNVSMSQMVFSKCPNLTKLTLPENIYGTPNASAFENANANLTVDFGGSEHAWKYVMGAVEPIQNATVTYLHGAQVEHDDNGVEYLLNEDDTYTLVGFYAVRMDVDGTTPLPGYILQPTFNGKNVTRIAAAAFNAYAYDGDIRTWLSTQLGALVLRNSPAPATYEDNFITQIGANNFVGLSAVAQLALPSTLDQTHFFGCFRDLNAAAHLRVPRGIEVAVDCFQWDNTAGYFGGTGGKYVVLPASFEKFSGYSWIGKQAAFGVYVDVPNDGAVNHWKAIVNGSDFLEPEEKGRTPNKEYLTSSGFNAATVLGIGNGANFTYELFLNLGF